MDQLLSSLATAGMDVISVLVKMIIFVVAYYGLKFLRGKVGAHWAGVIVNSIEQTAKDLAGPDKKPIVAGLLKKKLGFLFSAKDIDHLIEAAVYELNQIPRLATAVLDSTNPGPIIETPQGTPEKVPDPSEENVHTEADKTSQVTAGQ